MYQRRHAPAVVALVGSARVDGNTSYAVRLATEELERRGLHTRTVMLCEHSVASCDAHDHPGSFDDPRAAEEIEQLLDLVYAADALILATPVYFRNVSAQMKAFMDRTNRRWLRKERMTPKVVGLVAIGAQGGLADTISALRRFLELSTPQGTPVETAQAHADALGDAERSEELHEKMMAMASQLAERLLPTRAEAQTPDLLSGGPE